MRSRRSQAVWFSVPEPANSCLDAAQCFALVQNKPGHVSLTPELPVGSGWLWDFTWNCTFAWPLFFTHPVFPTLSLGSPGTLSLINHWYPNWGSASERTWLLTVSFPNQSFHLSDLNLPSTAWSKDLPSTQAPHQKQRIWTLTWWKTWSDLKSLVSSSSPKCDCPWGPPPPAPYFSPCWAQQTLSSYPTSLCTDQLKI